MEGESVRARVKSNGQNRTAIEELTVRFGARLADVAPDSIAIEATGDTHALDAFVDKLRPFGILKLVRTGRVALEK